MCDPGHVGFGMRRILPASLRGNFQEIIGGLRDDGFEVRHFALLTEPATVVRRRGRSAGLEPRRQRWETDHLAEWLRRYATMVRNIHWNWPSRG